VREGKGELVWGRGEERLAGWVFRKLRGPYDLIYRRSGDGNGVRTDYWILVIIMKSTITHINQSKAFRVWRHKHSAFRSRTKSPCSKPTSVFFSSF
jgi:hypothetical protein